VGRRDVARGRAPTIAASRTWRGQQLDVGRLDMGRRVARLDVEPATRRGRRDVARGRTAHSYRVAHLARGQRRDVGGRDVARERAAHFASGAT
jgi:hypothetical protein